jgi:hypothetical protein
LTKGTTKNAPRASRKKKTEAEEKPKRLADLLDKALGAFEEKIGEDGFTPSLAEYIKLVQLEREIELESDSAKEVRVRWVAPRRASSKGK